MANKWSLYYWRLGLASFLAMSGAIAFSKNCTLAQPISDGTLGTESSEIAPNVVINGTPSDQINGGAIRGANLFHSFLEFNIGEGRGVYFNNPTGIENIIGRVTGGNPSIILGTLGVLGGNASLFLINPNGIIFGSNASLDVRGSFVGTTASNLNFADGNLFSATAQTTPLLTVSVPIGLQFGSNAGRIFVQGDGQGIRISNIIDTSTGLRVQPDQTLALVGNNVVLEGATLKTAGGRLELGSVANSSLVSLNPTSKGWVLGYEGVQNFQDILMSQQAVVDASGAGGGDIQVQGRLVRLTDGSQIEASTLTSEPGGTLAVKASEAVEITGISAEGNPSALSALVYEGATGTGGNLTVETRRLSIQDGAALGTRTDGTKSGGSLSVNASESVELAGYRSRLFTQTGSAGDAGNLTLTTKRLSISDGAQVSASNASQSQGRGGDLTVEASEFVELTGIGTSPNGEDSIPSGLFTRAGGAKDAGDLKLVTKRLSIQGGAQVSASTFAQGQGGDLVVNASESVELAGTSSDGYGSGLFTQTEGVGNAGDLMITTKRLSIEDEAVVSVSSLGKSGDAGKLEVKARSISLDNQGLLTAETESGQGGDIALQAQDFLLLRRGSKISTTAGSEGAGGNGGNTGINTDLLIILEDSVITANAFTGEGGKIKINAQGLLRSPNSEISASSEFGVDGVVEINTPDIEHSRGLAPLPADIVDVSGLIAQGCAAGSNVASGSSEFVITGRGGLPPTPSEALRSDAVQVDLGRATQNQKSNPSAAVSNPLSSKPVPIVEAQGWAIGENGQVMLTAAPTVIPNNSWLNSTTCHGR